MNHINRWIDPARDVLNYQNYNDTTKAQFLSLLLIIYDEGDYFRMSIVLNFEGTDCINLQ